MLTPANKEENKKGSFLTPQNGSFNKTLSVISQQRSKERNPSRFGQWGLFLAVKHPHSSSALLGISEEIANAVEFLMSGWVKRTNTEPFTLDSSLLVAVYQAKMWFCLLHLHCPTNNNYFFSSIGEICNVIDYTNK